MGKEVTVEFAFSTLSAAIDIVESCQPGLRSPGSTATAIDVWKSHIDVDEFVRLVNIGYANKSDILDEEGKTMALEIYKSAVKFKEGWVAGQTEAPKTCDSNPTTVTEADMPWVLIERPDATSSEGRSPTVSQQDCSPERTCDNDMETDWDEVSDAPERDNKEVV